MSSELAEKKCVPCEGGVEPLDDEAIGDYLERVGDRWTVVDGHHLETTFEFDDFQGALDFTNRAGEIAEEEGHHPEICVTWGKATVRIWTHAIDGLHENDFILAAKYDEIRDGS